MFVNIYSNINLLCNYLRIGTGVPCGDMIFSKLDHLGSSHVHTARTSTNLDSNIDNNPDIDSRGSAHLWRVLGKWRVVESLGCGDTRLLLHPRVLAGQEVLGFVLALGEVGEVPVLRSIINIKRSAPDIWILPVSYARR